MAKRAPRPRLKALREPSYRKANPPPRVVGIPPLYKTEFGGGTARDAVAKKYPGHWIGLVPVTDGQKHAGYVLALLTGPGGKVVYHV